MYPLKCTIFGRTDDKNAGYICRWVQDRKWIQKGCCANYVEEVAEKDEVVNIYENGYNMEKKNNKVLFVSSAECCRVGIKNMGEITEAAVDTIRNEEFSNQKKDICRIGH